VGSFFTNMIVQGVVAVFTDIGTAVAHAFTAELSLVQKFISNDNLVFGGSFQKLLDFNAVIIPSLAMLIFLVWLAAKGLSGGNSKSSTEEMLKRIMGALVISFVLSILVDPVEKLVGALDDALISVASVNSQGLAHTFGTIFAVSSLTGIEDSIFITLLILFIGLILVGLLILILVVAHAAVFLLIYFAPYLTLFRKDGFREAVEGVVAAISMPFIITSILAVGIAAMGATGTIQTSALGSDAANLSAMVGDHLVSFSTALTASGGTVDPVQYFSNAFGGILILFAAIILPKFIIGGIFQAGAAFHDAFEGAAKRTSGRAAGSVLKNSDQEKGSGKISRGMHKVFGGGDGSSSGEAVTGNSKRGVDRSKLQDEIISGKSGTTRTSGTASSPGAGSDRMADGSNTRSSTRPAGAGNSADGESDQSVQSTPDGSDVSLPSDGPGGGNGAPSPDDGETEEKKKDPEVKLNTKEWIGSHYKGTLKAVPEAFENIRIHPENPLQTAFDARAAWRASKRKNIRQVRGDMRAVKAQEIASQPSDTKPPRQLPPPPPPPPPPDRKPSGDGNDAGGNQKQSQYEPERATPKLPGDGGS
jgi:hypothetical protein